MVYRIYSEKKKELTNEAKALLNDARELLGVRGLTGVRLINRYDAENITEETFRKARDTVFSEPQQDITYETLPSDGAAAVFAVEYLPGQFDQRADSAAQCIQILSRGERPVVRSAKVYALYGDLTEADVAAIKKYVINPVEAREAAMEKPATLLTAFDRPESVPTVDGFTALDEKGLTDLVSSLGLAMDVDDIRFCRDYFRKEGRDPTLTEIRMIDTYWSDHCRHTTFLTIIDDVEFSDPLLKAAYEDYLAARKSLGRENKPICLMDIATLAAKALRAEGKLDKLDESEEINACTVKADVTVDGKKEPWLLLFKNETHNHPTEIEPFGGAATCIGGAIRDPLSGRAYVYGAMRVTGAADPTVPIRDTLPGKLPQRTIVTTAAAGYSSYGNQIGLATGIVDEIYHPGYAAKRMEIGAVIAAAPADNVRREVPAPGDVVILLGGATGRDGIGGATGSSKAHTASSVETCGAEVQKGNAPEERKLQRLFRDPAATRLIKRCNDFGAGGVSVAIGELADGLDIDLDAVPKKYEGLDGTELAISESQERMAVVIDPKDVPLFLEKAAAENLSATPVAVVKAERRLTMRWKGNTIVDLSRDFLNSNGAEKHITVTPAAARLEMPTSFGSFTEEMTRLAGDLNICSKRALSERFDSTIGAGTVLMPFGGRYQRTPIQAMVQKISSEKGEVSTCSLMSYGFDPDISSQSPYHGAYLAVVESVAKLIASGADFKDVYLTFQEYFERPGKDGKRWGKPLAALLGAFAAQRALGVAAIGGKDSMSGSFEDLDVPPTLVSFAVTTQEIGEIISPELKTVGNRVVLLTPEYDENGLPVTASLIKLFDKVTDLVRRGSAVSVYTPERGGVAAALMKMAFGNGLGVRIGESVSKQTLFSPLTGAFLLEIRDDSEAEHTVAVVTDRPTLSYGGEEIPLDTLLSVYERKLEGVYPSKTPEREAPETLSYGETARRSPALKTARPRVLIPVFPGTNCEYDSARAVEAAGGRAEILVVNNLSAEGVDRSVEAFAGALSGAQMVFIPGGFSGGDEPEGSGKFITAFFRNEAVKEGVEDLLSRRDGLMCGICNGFQALIKLGLVPYGRIIETDASCPTLTFNTIGRHQSRIVRTRVASVKSPWLARRKVGDIISVPISHGEGRFIASDEVLADLIKNGQIATQYVDEAGKATYDILYNPNGSLCAVEGVTSPDGRVFGKMGHSERIGKGLYKNVPGDYDLEMFAAAVDYFK